MANKRNTQPVEEIQETPELEIPAGKDYLTIPEAAKISGLSEIYIRRAINTGALETEKVPVKEGSKTLRHEILVTSFEAWRQAAGSHTRRGDGRNKYVLYMNKDEEASLQKLVEDGEFTGVYSRANQPKDVEATEA